MPPKPSALTDCSVSWSYWQWWSLMRGLRKFSDKIMKIPSSVPLFSSGIIDRIPSSSALAMMC